MGDRFWMNLGCAYCGKMSFVYYAPTCEFFDFKCRTADLDDGMGSIENETAGCGRVNFITAGFSVKKVEDVVVDDVRQAIEMSTTSVHTDARLRKWANDSYKSLLKRAGQVNAR